MSRSVEHKVEAIVIFGEAQRNYHEAVRIFNDRYPDRPISRTYLRELLRKFQATGSVHSMKRSAPSQIPEDQHIDILADIVANPTQPTSQVAKAADVSASTVQRLLKKHQFHPYKMQILHQLIDDDPDRRIEYCEIMTERIVQNPNYLKTICFSDECTFFLNGIVNKQNVRYWCDENPHVFREGHTQFPEKLNVWAGILGNHIVGPLFLEETLTGQLYLDLLENFIHPLIIDIVENNEEEFGDADITFQQDGAPPHYSLIVRNFLNTGYPGRWIGRRGPTEWPPPLTTPNAP